MKKGDQFQDALEKHALRCGCKTPVIVHWEGKTKAGKYDDLVSTVDLAPTVLTACGANVPDTMSGVSLLDVAAGKGPLKREAVVGEIYVHTAIKIEDPRANLTYRWIRAGDWKLIVPVKEGNPELYNLRDDPLEKTNLAEKESEIVGRLKKRLEETWK